MLVVSYVCILIVREGYGGEGEDKERFQGLAVNVKLGRRKAGNSEKVAPMIVSVGSKEVGVKP